MFYRHESHFYSSYEQELTTGPNSYAMIDLVNIVDAISGRGVNAPNVLDKTYAKAVLDELISRLREKSPSRDFKVSDEDIDRVAKVAAHRKSPY
jgi:hypothetical protein